jgi:predicted  nucleic acid-binding Zn-ribbon protein
MNNIRFTAPVFENGIQVGSMPIGQMDPQPLPQYRDVASEQAARIAWSAEAMRAANPELFAARRQLLRCQQTTLHYGNLVSDLRFAISQKSAEMNSANPDYVGLAAERREQLRALQAQLSEAEEEYDAAVEEETVAREALAKLTVTT